MRLVYKISESLIRFFKKLLMEIGRLHARVVGMSYKCLSAGDCLNFK